MNSEVAIGAMNLEEDILHAEEITGRKVVRGKYPMIEVTPWMMGGGSLEVSIYLPSRGGKWLMLHGNVSHQFDSLEEAIEFLAANPTGRGEIRVSNHLFDFENGQVVNMVEVRHHDGRLAWRTEAREGSETYEAILDAVAFLATMDYARHYGEYMPPGNLAA